MWHPAKSNTNEKVFVSALIQLLCTEACSALVRINKNLASKGDSEFHRFIFSLYNNLKVIHTYIYTPHFTMCLPLKQMLDMLVQRKILFMNFIVYLLTGKYI